MVTIAIGFLVGFIWNFISMKRDACFELGDLIGLSIIIGMLSGLVGLLLALILPASTETAITTYQLEALKDNGAVSGRFFLGSGQIEGDYKYACYIKSGDYYQLNVLSRQNTFIQYTQGNPVLEVQEQVMKKDWINWFSVKALEKPVNVVKIPKGSILNSYELDAQ